VELLGHDETHVFRPFRFRVTNVARVPVYVLGFYSLRDPDARVEVECDGGWRAVPTWRGCGAGIGWFPLQPGMAAEFDLHLHLEENPERARTRVGLTYRSRGGDIDEPESWLDAWSSPFVPEGLLSLEQLIALARDRESGR
jgi:hypothetical protein